MRALAHLVLLALAGGVLFAPALGAALVASDVLLSAQAEDDRLLVAVAAGDSEGPAHVLVTHDDPLIGPVVDRVVPIQVRAGATTVVELDGLRPDVEVDVRLLAPDPALPTISNVTQLPLAKELLDVLPLTGPLRIPLPDLPLESPQDLEARLIRAGSPFGAMGLTARTSGLLVLASPEPGEGNRANITFATSGDGGRTWKALATNLSSWNGYASWAWDAAAAGPLTIAHPRLSWAGGSFTTQGFDYVRLDPELGRATHKGPLTHGDARAVALASLPGLRVAVAELTASGPIRIHALEPDGRITPVSTVANAGDYNDRVDVRLESSRSGQLVLAWTEAGKIRLARSLDQGRTFDTLPPIAELDQSSLRRTSRAVVDATGTLQLLTVVPHGNMSRIHHVRWAPQSDPVVKALSGPSTKVPDSVNEPSATIAQAGLRTWVFWTSTGAAGAARAAESLDAGLSFGPAYVLKPADGDNFYDFQDATLFPDGRPALLAGFNRGGGTYGSAVAALYDPLADPSSPLVDIGFQEGVVQYQNRAQPVMGPGFEPGSPVVVPSYPSLSLPATAAAGTAVAAGLLFLVPWRYLTGLAAAGLYSRVKRSELLDNPIRAAVHRHILENPGIRYERLRRELGLTNGALAHHLRKLKQAALVVTRRRWTRVHYYVPSGVSVPPAAATPDMLVEALRQRPEGATAADVARRLQISRQLARYHLGSLARQNRAQVIGRGRNRAYRLADHLRPPGR